MNRWTAGALVLAVAGCGGTTGKPEVSQGRAATPAQGAAPWPAPTDPMRLTVKAGLKPETHEFVLLHVHSHLDVFVNGRSVTVPAAIGIEIHDPAVHRLEQPDGTIAYGGINRPCSRPCISPLHTHDATGLLHTEAKENEFNDLGELFTEWNVRLDRKCIGGYCRPAAPISVFVDGDAYTDDPRKIELEDGREIAIVIGTPPEEIPSSFGR